jgi:hypothetical protein
MTEKRGAREMKRLIETVEKEREREREREREMTMETNYEITKLLFSCSL